MMYRKSTTLQNSCNFI